MTVLVDDRLMSALPEAAAFVYEVDFVFDERLKLPENSIWW